MHGLAMWYPELILSTLDSIHLHNLLIQRTMDSIMFQFSNPQGVLACYIGSLLYSYFKIFSIRHMGNHSEYTHVCTSDSYWATIVSIHMYVHMIATGQP